MRGLYLLAPAKLNLFLHVFAPRSDGYHPLHTYFQYIGLFDELYFAILPTTRLQPQITITMQGCGTAIQNNIINQAAQLLYAYITTPKPNIHVAVCKHIPIGAGLGGGSSNAATTLHALNMLWKLQLPQQQIQELSLELGADLPFFVKGESGFASGIGEVMTAYAYPDLYCVVVLSGIHCVTSAVFLHKQLTTKKQMTTIPPAYQELTINEVVGLGNDCIDAAFAEYPKLKQVYSIISNYGQFAMTGTGSTFFAVYQSKQQAMQLAKRICDERALNAIVVPSIARWHTYWGVAKW